MGTAPKKPSSSPTGSGKGKGGTPPQQVPLTEMLAKEGAPWRPFEDTGVLIKPLKTPRSAAAIFAACEKTLLAHLKAVCMWPEKERNQSWREGGESGDRRRLTECQAARANDGTLTCRQVRSEAWIAQLAASTG